MTSTAGNSGDRSAGSGRYRVRLSFVIVVILVVYGLSIGPAFKFGTTTRQSNEIFVRIYRPILTLSELDSPIAKGINWYLCLWKDWRPKSPPKAPGDP